jgi:phospholipid/cholesterol/gamma-HCH transport system ATP-binding protein
VAILVQGKFLKSGSFDEVFKSENEIARTFYEYNFINDK